MQHTRVDREVIENVEEDSSIINLKVLNNINSHGKSSQQPCKRSTDGKNMTNKKISRKSKDTRKIRSTTSRVDEDTLADENESTTIAAEARRSMQPNEEEPNGSEESRNAKREDAKSLDQDIDDATRKIADLDTEPKLRLGNLLKKTEKIVKIKESFEEDSRDSRMANRDMERSSMLDMENKLDQLISKLLKETEEANKNGFRVTPSVTAKRPEYTNNVHQSGQRPVTQNRCADTLGSVCYNPFERMISHSGVPLIIPKLVSDFPQRVVMQPRYRSVIYHN